MTHRIILALVALFMLAAPANAGTAFLSHETNDDGMFKQCVYDYLGEEFVITISSVKLCPLTIRVP